ncbi:hypothetical protein JL09_g6936, partial [Pichia kudriavzevii]
EAGDEPNGDCADAARFDKVTEPNAPDVFVPNPLLPNPLLPNPLLPNPPPPKPVLPVALPPNGEATDV